MYDSEYFRKVIGDNYNPNELYNNSDEVNSYSTDTKVAKSADFVNNTVEQTMKNSVLGPTYNVSNIKTDSALEYLHNMNKDNTEENPIRVYNNASTEQNIEKTSKLTYPNIYNVINPMVDTILKNTQNIEYNDSTINAMSTEIYNALEVDINPQKTTEQTSAFNNKEQTSTFNSIVQVNTTPKNHLLHDLIKIMIIAKIEKGQ